MKNPLATYLHDHLAGAMFAIELLESLRDRQPGDSMGQWAGELLLEIQEDRGVLKMLLERIDNSSHAVAEAVSWIAEKASRLKLRRQTADTLGTFESIEALALGILGKEALWNTLREIASGDRRVHGLDFEALIARARTQHARVEAQRLLLAKSVFAEV